MEEITEREKAKMSIASSLSFAIRHTGLALVISFIMFGYASASDPQQIAPLGKLPMTPSSTSWSVSKVGKKIIARNGMTGKNLTAFTDLSEEGKHEYENRRYESHTDYEIVSLVGPVLSVCESWYSDGGAHPSYGARFVSVNLDKGGEELALTDVFDESEVLKALLRDRVVKKALGGKTPESLAELEVADGGCEMTFLHIRRSFAFHHVKGNAVAVRIGLQHGCEVMRGNFTQIGIYLPLSTGIGYFKQSVKKHTLMPDLWKFK